MQPQKVSAVLEGSQIQFDSCRYRNGSFADRCLGKGVAAGGGKSWQYALIIGFLNAAVISSIENIMPEVLRQSFAICLELIQWLTNSSPVVPEHPPVNHYLNLPVNHDSPTLAAVCEDCQVLVGGVVLDAD